MSDNTPATDELAAAQARIAQLESELAFLRPYLRNATVICDICKASRTADLCTCSDLTNEKSAAGFSRDEWL